MQKTMSLKQIRFAIPILLLLKSRGGSEYTDYIRETLPSKLDPPLTASDLTPNKSDGYPSWWTHAKWTRNELITLGYLFKASHGEWALTAKGRELANLPLEEQRRTLLAPLMNAKEETLYRKVAEILRQEGPQFLTENPAVPIDAYTVFARANETDLKGKPVPRARDFHEKLKPYLEKAELELALEGLMDI